jgi:uncharacterized protein involved in response to NO
MAIDPRETVLQIVERYPEAAPILARFGLDTCCGGARLLEDACRVHRLDLEEVLTALQAATPADTPQPCGHCAAPATEPRRISPGTNLKAILAEYPSAGEVLARHGLMGCGGREGPDEPLSWFARVHGVTIEPLLAELEAAAARDDAARAAGTATAAGAPPPSREELRRENLYRRFLKTSLLFTLTGGTALGAWALVVMAMRERLGGIERGVIQVHGHWQLFGWVGLFVVGVAYHVLPRLVGRPLPSYRAASWSFVMLAMGVVLRCGQAFDPSSIRTGLLYGGALLEIAGCAVFAWTVWRLLAVQGGRPLPWQRYLAHGTAWLVAASLLNLAHAWNLVEGPRFEVDAWLNVPYLSVFLVGFVTFWILGVSLRTLPVFMGLEDRPVFAAGLVWPLSLTVAGLAIGEGLFLRNGGTAARVLFGVSGLLLPLGLALFTLALGVLRPVRQVLEPEVDRGYEKYVRLAYAWLLLAGGMLFVFSIVTLRGAPLDHAYVGAYRHALTVGFITTMMIGMAQRIVPVFRGVPLWSPRLREWIFWLLAVGNVMRVLFQSLSAAADPAWLRLAGVSGLLELSALVLFAINLWKTMDTETADDRAAGSWRPPIDASTRVGDLLEAYPALLPVFVGNGFAPLANPILRRTLARGVSVAQACRMHGVEIEGFLGRLRQAAEAAGR